MQRLGGPLIVFLRLVAAAGLIVDAIVHLQVASTQPPAGSGQIDQSTLFRIEGVVAILAAAAVLLLNSRLTSALAALVAGSAFAAVMVSVYVDLGSIGPLPDLYEPAWYPTKTTSAVAEAIATVAAIALLVTQIVRHRATTRDPAPTDEGVPVHQ